MTPTRALALSTALAAVVAATVGMARDVPEEAPPPRKVVYYMPTTKGDTMVHRTDSAGQVSQGTETVTRVADKDGQRVVTVTDERGTATEYVVSGRGVWALGRHGMTFPEPVPFVLRSAADGETLYDREGVPLVLKFGGVEKVTVPAGTFEALRLEAWARGGGEPGPAAKTWFGPGVGEVKYEAGKTVSRVLVKFTPGKAQP